MQAWMSVGRSGAFVGVLLSELKGMSLNDGDIEFVVSNPPQYKAGRVGLEFQPAWLGNLDEQNAFAICRSDSYAVFKAV